MPRGLEDTLGPSLCAVCMFKELVEDNPKSFGRKVWKKVFGFDPLNFLAGHKYVRYFFDCDFQDLQSAF